MRLFTGCLLSLLVSGVALADPIGGSAAPTFVSPAPPAPTPKGGVELLRMAPPASNDTVLDSRPHGFGIGQTNASGTSVFGYIGLGGGIAYALTDMLQVGAAVSFYVNGAGGGLGTSGIYEVLGEPLLKLNLGPMLKTGAINPTVMAGFSFGVQGTTGAFGQAWGLFGADVDPGVEWLFGGRWGIDVYIPLQLQFATAQNSQVGFNIGVGYGLIGYL